MKVITSVLIDELIARAAASGRRRTNHNLHESPSDPIQRMFVAAMRDSYFRPHRHAAKREFAAVIRGRFDVLLFDDTGCVTRRISVGPGAEAVGFEIPPDTWHSWIPLADGSVFVEVKQGPYDSRTAADFAVWAPAEGTADVGRYLERLRNTKVGDRATQAPPPHR
jgi:cupin fold WbuC family metalloprotein